MKNLSPLPLAEFESLDNRDIWRALTTAHRHLAELKGLCESLPNRAILLDTLSIQEAKDSSEIENIISTHDEIYSSQPNDAVSASAKEVRHYANALRVGYESVRETGLIRVETILKVHSELEQHRTGFRTLPGTKLKNEMTGEVVYEPPQDAQVIESLMHNLVDFIHTVDELDPLLKMAITHHQFESIHPFYDGNGRTGRILNLLMLQQSQLLDLPVLYLSRYITSNKPEYYRLLQSVRQKNRWQEWCLYLLQGVATTSRSTIRTIKAFRDLMAETEQTLRKQAPKIYSRDLLNLIFRYPYTRIEFVERDLGVSRVTASKYLNHLARQQILTKKRVGKRYYFINTPLFELLSQVELD
ncbi:MAG: Fic family protein [Verrucomicrobiota bacterium]